MQNPDNKINVTQRLFCCLCPSRSTDVRRVCSVFQAMVCQCKFRPIPAIMHLTCTAAQGVPLCSV